MSIPLQEEGGKQSAIIEEGRLIENAVAKLAPKIKKQAAAVALPENLRQQLEAELKASPALSWDEAAADLVADLAE